MTTAKAKTLIDSDIFTRTLWLKVAKIEDTTTPRETLWNRLEKEWKKATKSEKESRIKQKVRDAIHAMMSSPPRQNNPKKRGSSGSAEEATDRSDEPAMAEKRGPSIPKVHRAISKAAKASAAAGTPRRASESRSTVSRSDDGASDGTEDESISEGELDLSSSSDADSGAESTAKDGLGSKGFTIVKERDWATAAEIREQLRREAKLQVPNRTDTPVRLEIGNARKGSPLVSALVETARVMYGTVGNKPFRLDSLETVAGVNGLITAVSFLRTANPMADTDAARLRSLSIHAADSPFIALEGFSDTLVSRLILEEKLTGFRYDSGKSIVYSSGFEDDPSSGLAPLWDAPAGGDSIVESLIAQLNKKFRDLLSFASMEFEKQRTRAPGNVCDSNSFERLVFDRTIGSLPDALKAHRMQNESGPQRARFIVNVLTAALCTGSYPGFEVTKKLNAGLREARPITWSAAAAMDEEATAARRGGRVHGVAPGESTLRADQEPHRGATRRDRDRRRDRSGDARRDSRAARGRSASDSPPRTHAAVEHPRGEYKERRSDDFDAKVTEQAMQSLLAAPDKPIRDCPLHPKTKFRHTIRDCRTVARVTHPEMPPTRFWSVNDSLNAWRAKAGMPKVKPRLETTSSAPDPGTGDTA